MSLVVAMPMQLVNTSRAECELTNRLEQKSDYLARQNGRKFSKVRGDMLKRWNLCMEF